MNRSTESRAAFGRNRSFAAAIAFAGAASSLLTAGDAFAAPVQAKVWVVGPSGAFSDIQGAVDAAVAGDIVVVDAGTYTGFVVDAKELTIVARVDASAGEKVEVAGEVTIRNLALGDTVVLQGDAFSILGANGPALSVLDSLGSVRLQGLTLEGACGFSGADGAAGLRVDHSFDVAVVSSFISGGIVCDYPGNGGHGIELDAGNLALYGVTAEGRDGEQDLATLGAPGTAGGSGCLVKSGFLFASHSTFQGGDGAGGGDGFMDCATGGIEPGSGGDGGDGIALETSNAIARVMGCLRDGGLGGPVGVGTLCTATDGAPGKGDSIAAGATFVDDPMPVRSTLGPCLSSELSSVLLHFEGQPGDRFYLFLSTATQFVDEPTFHGVTLVKTPYLYRLVMGTLPASGMLDTGYAIGDLGAGVEGVVWHAQTYVRTVSNKRMYGGPASLVMLDSQF
ncbi:MAG: hypothetical protein IT453_02535 [Planctomycetes bacterium]|nr:hypothetical protein [Planctomycetota bacterium]